MLSLYSRTTLQSAIEESERLYAELQAHEASWPAVEQRFNELDQQCLALAPAVMTAERAESPTRIPLQHQLNELQRERKNVKRSYAKRRDELLTAIGHSVAPAIQNEIATFEVLKKEITNSRQAHVVERRHDLYNDKKIVEVESNLAQLDKAVNLCVEAINEIRDMTGKTVRMVMDRATELRKQITAINLSESTVDTVSTADVKDIVNPDPPGAAQPAWLVGSGVVMSGGVVDSATHARQTMSKMDALLAKRKGVK